MRELWSASDRDLISSMTLFLPIHGRFSYLTETFIIINKNKNHKMDLLWSQACNWMWLSDTSYFLLLLHIPSYILLSLPTSSYFLIVSSLTKSWRRHNHRWTILVLSYCWDWKEAMKKQQYLILPIDKSPI